MAKKSNEGTATAVAIDSVCTLKGTAASKHMKTGQEYHAVPGKTANHLIANGHADLVKEYSKLEWAAEVKREQQRKEELRREAEEARKKAK